MCNYRVDRSSQLRFDGAHGKFGDTNRAAITLAIVATGKDTLFAHFVNKYTKKEQAIILAVRLPSQCQMKKAGGKMGKIIRKDINGLVLGSRGSPLHRHHVLTVTEMHSWE
ncbi:hypothetical protein N7445_010711 [Penicillium cf. griseofulvum]|nr:hypothetical protein N7445_010711 [Penicillium cf. griseofulvum]